MLSKPVVFNSLLTSSEVSQSYSVLLIDAVAYTQDCFVKLQIEKLIWAEETKRHFVNR